MFYYSIGYGSYEDSDYIQLMHETEFGKRKFEQIIFDAVPFVLEELKTDFLNKDAKYHWYYDFYDKRLHIGFDALFSIFAEVLCEHFGFERMGYTASFHLFGWPNMMEEDSWDHEKADKKYAKLAVMIRDGLKDVEIHPDHTRDYFTEKELMNDN